MALVELFPAILKCLEEMQITGNLATSRNASLLLNSLRTCVNIMALSIAQHMSSLLLPLTTHRQSNSLDLVACCTQVDAIVAVMAHYRNSEMHLDQLFPKLLNCTKWLEQKLPFHG